MAFPSLATRLDRLERLKAAVSANATRLVEAIEQDFGQRSEVLSRLAEVATVIRPLVFAQEHLAEWMKPQPRVLSSPLSDFGASGRIEFQPLGVVGVMAPWNAPARLVFQPLVDILAAEVIAEMITAAFESPTWLTFASSARASSTHATAAQSPD